MIKKHMLTLFSIVIVSGCFYTAPSFRYSMLYPDSTPYGGVDKKYHFRRPFFKEQTGWSICSEANKFATCASSLQINDNGEIVYVGNITISFFPAITKDNILCAPVKSERRTVRVEANIADKNSNYIYDTTQFYIIKDGEKIHLEVEKIYPDNVNPYGQISLDKAFIIITYRTPYICKDLEGVEVVMGGLYRNGEKMPALRFRMNYTDSLKKRWDIK